MSRKLVLSTVIYLTLSLGMPFLPYAGQESETLHLALLPIPDVLPVYVAQARGYFEEAAISVQPLPVGSAMERDQLMQAGKVDGMINDIADTANFNREQGRVKIISIARSPIGDAYLCPNAC